MSTTLHSSNTVLARPQRINRFCNHLIAYVAVVGGLLALNYSNNPENMWSYWVLAGWGIGIVYHGVRAFCLPRQVK